MAPRNVGPVPGTRGEDEPDERELGSDRDHRRRAEKLPEQHADEHDSERHREREASLREQDERVLGAQPENLVEDPRGGDVGRTYSVVGDRVRVADRDDGLQRSQVALLVVPAREHDARPTARREERVDREPDDEEEPVDAVDELALAVRAVGAREVVCRVHGRLVRRRLVLSVSA